MHGWHEGARGCSNPASGQLDTILLHSYVPTVSTPCVEGFCLGSMLWQAAVYSTQLGGHAFLLSPGPTSAAHNWHYTLQLTLATKVTQLEMDKQRLQGQLWEAISVAKSNGETFKRVHQKVI